MSTNRAGQGGALTSIYDQGDTRLRARRMGRAFMGVLVAATVVGVAPPASAATFMVNSTNDVSDGACDSTHCNLREAITASNAATGMDTINFNIAGSGPHTIVPSSALPVINSPTVVDGTSEPDYAVGSPVIELDGINASANFLPAFNVQAGPSTIKGLVINRFDVGIRLLGVSANNNTVSANFIGTNVQGTAAAANRYGVLISSNNNIIGGSSASDRNVISGNRYGVVIMSNSSGNQMRGNYIGTSASGTSAVANESGVSVEGPNNVIGSAGNGNVISGNSTRGITVQNSGNTVAGNYVGVDATGAAPLGNGGTGIYVNSPGNTIGGTAAGAGNVISANFASVDNTQANGLDIAGSGASNNVVQGNYIGTDATGTLDFGNSHRGINLNMAPNNQIGGSAPGAGNLISGNAWDGIAATRFADGTTIQGNKIGTDASGQAALGNSWGITLQGINGLIGGTSPGAGNLVSGNSLSGIYVGGTGATIQGNKVGTDASGQSDLGNAGKGIEVSASGAVIGGTSAASGNLVSGNAQEGISVVGTGATIQGNKIGTDASGQSAIGNSDIGIRVSSSTNLVGGDGAGAGNTVAFNSSYGVRVGLSDVSNQNRILANSIFSNGKRGIGLSDPAVPLNDAGDADAGPNNLQNFPTVSSISSSGDTRTIGGGLSSQADTTYRLELFANPACDPSGYGEGKTYLGSTSVTTDGSGSATFSFGAGSSLEPGDFVTATATDPNGNTSEFSQCKRFNRAPVLSQIDDQTVAEDATLTFEINASDADGDSLTYSQTQGPGSFEPSTRTFSWTPGYNDAGSHNATFEVADGNGGSDSQSITITVTNMNRAPELAQIDDQTVAEGATLTFEINASDADGDSLTYSQTQGPGSFEPSTRTFSWTPGYGDEGPHDATFEVSDGNGGSDSESITITVTHADGDPPVVEMQSPTKPFVLTKSFLVAWNGTDSDSGVDSYDVRYLEASHTSSLGAPIDWKTATADVSANFSGKAGYAYCYSVRATDGNNNVSVYTPERCTAVPLDDVDLKKSRDWDRKRGRGYYLKTYSVASEKGARLSVADVVADRLALVATRCPGCGTVKVFMGRTLLKKVSLAAPVRRKKQLIAIKTFDSTRTGAVKIVVASSGKPVLIEGLGIGKKPS